MIRKNIAKIQSYKFDLIVGIPRSGIIPAYMIALYINKKCCDIEALITNTPVKTGSTRQVKGNLIYPHHAKNILLVDDSIMTGKSLAKELSRLPEGLKSKITTLAIYSSEIIRSDVDLVLEHLPLPRVFEWNIFHHSIVERSCFDIDGVLCVDPIGEQNDDAENYLKFISNAQLLHVPTLKINMLVTSRLEKYRPETEAWLRKKGIEYGSLIMLDLPSKEERQRLNSHADFKAKAYKKSGQDLFYESDRHQAMRIHELTRKPVYCIDSNEMFSKGEAVSAIYGSRNSRKIHVLNLLKRLPHPIYNWMRSIYRHCLIK